MASNRNSVKRDLIGSTLQARIANLKKGPNIIQGSLSVAPGHDYWWFLEYGTGQFHEDPGDELVPPDSAAGEEAEGTEYEIEAGGDYFLVYMTKTGMRRRRHATSHPGIYPIGFVRTALFEAEISLKAGLTRAEKKRKKWDELPGREALVAMVNRVLAALLKTLQVTTPPDSDIDPYHEKPRHSTPLSEAWKITKAK